MPPRRILKKPESSSDSDEQENERSDGNASETQKKKSTARKSFPNTPEKRNEAEGTREVTTPRSTARKSTSSKLSFTNGNQNSSNESEREAESPTTPRSTARKSTTNRLAFLNEHKSLSNEAQTASPRSKARKSFPSLQNSHENNQYLNSEAGPSRELSDQGLATRSEQGVSNVPNSSASNTQMNSSRTTKSKHTARKSTSGLQNLLNSNPDLNNEKRSSRAQEASERIANSNVRRRILPSEVEKEKEASSDYDIAEESSRGPRLRETRGRGTNKKRQSSSSDEIQASVSETTKSGHTARKSFPCGLNNNPDLSNEAGPSRRALDQTHSGHESDESHSAASDQADSSNRVSARGPTTRSKQNIPIKPSSSAMNQTEPLRRSRRQVPINRARQNESSESDSSSDEKCSKSRRASQRLPNNNVRRRLLLDKLDNYEESSSEDDSDEDSAREQRSRQAKGRKKRQRSSSGDEDFVEPTPLSRQSTNPKKNVPERVVKPTQLINSVDGPTLQSLVHKCVYFLLIEDQKKYAIKRTSIIQNVFKDQGYSPKLYSTVITKASAFLKKTFGLELIEVAGRKGSYLIVNILNQELQVHDFCEVSKLKQQQYGFILYVLTIIFMNGNSISEDDFWKAVKPLGIDPTSRKPHPVFGDVKKYVTSELVKQMYLDYECVDNDPPARFELVWGARAHQEVDKKTLLEFACEIMNNAPEEWYLQHKDAQRAGNETLEDS